MKLHGILSWLLFLALLISLVGVVQAQPKYLSQPGRALVYVALPTRDELSRFERTGLPAYARLHGDEGRYVLAGAGPAGRDALAAAGLSVRVLDADTTGATYYLVYLPGRLLPDWSTYGRVLLDDGTQVLVRMSPQDAEWLAEAGAQLRVLTLDPKPLRPAPVERDFPTAIQPDPFVQAIIDQVDSTTVYSYTGGLSGEWPVQIGGSPYTIATRYTYSGEPVQKATQLVGEHLAALGLDVEYHQWGGATYPNVIGELTGETNPNDIFIICAHLDDMPSGSLAPGADDNASGVVAVLIAADILTQYRWGCTLRFAAWTGEEQGLYGSHYYAQRAYNDGENIVGVLNLDMIAWNTPGSSPDIDLHADYNVPGSVTLAQLFADVVDAYDLNLIPQVLTIGTGSSDHASFWDYGYTAILGIEDFFPHYHDFNPRYHTTGDRLEYLDMPYYTDFVKASVATFVYMNDCLILSDCAPVQDADFTWEPSTLIVGEVVTFTGTASSTLPLAFTWNFGDGNIGMGQTVSHAYTSAGSYTVAMTATNCITPLVTITHTVNPVCIGVAGVELSGSTTGTVYTDTVVQFSANITPDNANKPYTYTVYVDGGMIISPQSSSDDPLGFSYTFATSDTHTVEIQVWNCDMAVPASDTVEVTVFTPKRDKYCYLPLVIKND